MGGKPFTKCAQRVHVQLYGIDRWRIAEIGQRLTEEIADSAVALMRDAASVLADAIDARDERLILYCTRNEELPPGVAARSYAWRQLLVARAIENQAFVAGVNRVGEDGSGIAHQGDSRVCDFLGKPLADLGNAPSVDTVELDVHSLRAFRERFPAHLDADRFTLTDP